MNKTYDPLFTPWKIGNVEIKNRIVMTSMGGTSIFGWMEPNHFDKEAARFLLERAKNNAGLILPGIAPIRDILLGKWLYQGKGKFDELKDFMEEFHKTGCKMFIQLTAGFGRSLAINDIMVKAMHNKALATVMKPVLDVSYLTASASHTQPLGGQLHIPPPHHKRDSPNGRGLRQDRQAMQGRWSGRYRGARGA